MSIADVGKISRGPVHESVAVTGVSTRLIDCGRCGGSGRDPKRRVRAGTRRGRIRGRCTRCLGLGKIVVEYPVAQVRPYFVRPEVRS